jgi:3'-phosphoadenosine 5'-phosphosulfate sulfotransferase (PAPS reductase)/FAD synthetase
LSLGCIPCTEPVVSPSETKEEIFKKARIFRDKERAGRKKDDIMERLRALGYM